MKQLEKKFPEVALNGLSDQKLRWQAWVIQTEIQQQVCSEVGITFVAPPSKTLSNDKYLHPKYFAQDTTHTNAKYGALVIQQILSHLSVEE